MGFDSCSPEARRLMDDPEFQPPSDDQSVIRKYKSDNRGKALMAAVKETYRGRGKPTLVDGRLVGTRSAVINDIVDRIRDKCGPYLVDTPESVRFSRIVARECGEPTHGLYTTEEADRCITEYLLPGTVQRTQKSLGEEYGLSESTIKRMANKVKGVLANGKTDRMTVNRCLQTATARDIAQILASLRARGEIKGAGAPSYLSLHEATWILGQVGSLGHTAQGKTPDIVAGKIAQSLHAVGAQMKAAHVYAHNTGKTVRPSDEKMAASLSEAKFTIKTYQNMKRKVNEAQALGRHAARRPKRSVR